MESILADYSVSISEFKKNPAEVIRNAGEKPVAVLSHNRPAFYMVSPKVFEAMLEEISDKELVEKVRTRLENLSSAVEVDIDDI
ncbi:MAG: type II toxin-antitoxin system prevent-host-death family antitoxin [Deferribacterales bacterium]